MALYLTFSISRPLDLGLRATRAAAEGTFDVEASAGASSSTAVLLGARAGAERGIAARRVAGIREPVPGPNVVGFFRRL